jgi:hypothetical protein
MSSYRDDLKRALWHSRECGKAIERACASLGIDPDVPVEESGLIEPPPPDDVPDSGFLPTPFDDELPGNPQGKRLRLVREFASRRYR